MFNKLEGFLFRMKVSGAGWETANRSQILGAESYVHEITFILHRDTELSSEKDIRCARFIKCCLRLAKIHYLNSLTSQTALASSS